MSKTRRAGRKNQLHRILAKYHRAAVVDYTLIIDTEYYLDHKYEQLFASAAKTTCNIKWPEHLIPIDVDVRPYRLATTHQEDPRGEIHQPPTVAALCFSGIIFHMARWYN